MQGFRAKLPKTLAPSAGAPQRSSGNTHCDNVWISQKQPILAVFAKLRGPYRANKPLCGLFSRHYHNRGLKKEHWFFLKFWKNLSLFRPLYHNARGQKSKWPGRRNFTGTGNLGCNCSVIVSGAFGWYNVTVWAWRGQIRDLTGLSGLEGRIWKDNE